MYMHTTIVRLLLPLFSSVRLQACVFTLLLMSGKSGTRHHTCIGYRVYYDRTLIYYSIYNVDQEIRPQFWLAGPQQNDRSSGQQCGHSAAFLISSLGSHTLLTSSTFVSNKNKKRKRKGCRRDQLCACAYYYFFLTYRKYVYV